MNQSKTTFEALVELREAFIRLGKEIWEYWFFRVWLVGFVAILLFIPTAAKVVGGKCTVTRVVDGDTFHCVTGGEDLIVRLIGINCAELPSDEGKAAKVFVDQNMPVGTVVRLELDVRKLDYFRRTLAYVWTCPPKPRAKGEPAGCPDGEIMLNELLLREGVAVLMTVPPNIKYTQELKNASSH